ncbi:glycosyltransferase family 4 protein [Candidatus Woesearchaeota archaeon]|nr:glycosyltransferase family 4 protein [Candidatus Woesearchaeota archaeon]
MEKEIRNVLIATDCFLPRWDGIARFLYEIIPKIKENFNITVVAPDFPGNKINIEGVKIIYFKTFLQISDISFAIPKKEILSKLIAESDIVFAQTMGPIGTNSVKIAKKMRKKIIAYVHSIEWELVSRSIGSIFRKKINSIVKFKARRHYNRCTKILVPSVDVAELFTWNKIRPKKEIVHLGTDSNKFCESPNKRLSKTDINIPVDHTVIGYIGRIAREKDLMTLYRAFVRVRKEHEKTILLIVGNGLESQKNFLRTKRNVIVLDAQNNPTRYYQAMDIFVLPSLTETTSLTVMEAMSCGLPVISTKVGFIKNYITKGVNGVFFEKKDAYSLYTKIAHLIENPELRDKLGKNARLTIINNYQWENTAKKIKKVLDEI